MEGYETLGVLGEGTYGVVIKARHRATGRLVAIKKYKQTDDDDHVRKTSLREVRVLKQLRHPNIISLLEVFRRDGKLYLVFEYVENTILQLIEEKHHGLLPNDVRRFTYQLLSGIDYCHAHNIIHRDVKPENILVSKGGVLKLCDFGFARQLSSKGKYTDYVATRWYRAPELLVGDVSYGKAVDIWAVGCIFSELSDGQPLFPGDSDLDQLSLILRHCGPVPERMVNIFEHNALYRRVTFPTRPVDQTLQQRFPRAPEPWMEFLSACLRTNPADRPSCATLMNMPYFTHDNFRAEYETELRALLQYGQTPSPMDGPSITPPLSRASPPVGADTEDGGESMLPLLAGLTANGGSSSNLNDPMDGRQAASESASLGIGVPACATYQQLGALWSHYLGATMGGNVGGEFPIITARQQQLPLQTQPPSLPTSIRNSSKGVAAVARTEKMPTSSPLQTMKLTGSHPLAKAPSSPSPKRHQPPCPRPSGCPTSRTTPTASHSVANAGGVPSGSVAPVSVTVPETGGVGGPGAGGNLSSTWKRTSVGAPSKNDAKSWKTGPLKKPVRLNYHVLPALPSGRSSPAPTTFPTTSNAAINALSVLRESNNNNNNNSSSIPKGIHSTHTNTVQTSTTKPTTTTNPTTSNVNVSGTSGVVNNNASKHKKKQSKRTKVPNIGLSQSGLTDSSPTVQNSNKTYRSSGTGQKYTFHDVQSKR